MPKKSNTDRSPLTSNPTVPFRRSTEVMASSRSITSSEVAPSCVVDGSCRPVAAPHPVRSALPSRRSAKTRVVISPVTPVQLSRLRWVRLFGTELRLPVTCSQWVRCMIDTFSRRLKVSRDALNLYPNGRVGTEGYST